MKGGEELGMKMGRGLFIMALIVVMAASLAAAEIPPSFFAAFGGLKNENSLCVKNYQAGATITEAYSNFQYLDKDTRVFSRTPKLDEHGCEENGSALVEASFSTDIVGIAHLDWMSADPAATVMRRHPVYGLSREELIGVFNIEKFILLASNSTLRENATEWLPCSLIY
jgi:hypothetical protein